MIDLKQFSGEIPRAPADKLPQGAAQLAVNCDLAHGELRSLKGMSTRFATSHQPVRGIFTDDGLRFFVWNEYTRAFLSPTVDDAYDRVYFCNASSGLRVTQASQMRLSSNNPGAPTASWKVGVSPAWGAIGVTVSGTATEGSTVETVSLVAVAVNGWGEESAPTAPVVFDISLGQSVAYSVSVTPDAAQRSLAGVNFYRTYASSESTDYILVNSTPAAISGGVATFNDPNVGAATATILTSQTWDAPPAFIFDVCYIGNGMVCGAVGKDLCITEPYRPHAWAYRMSFPYGITGLIPVEGGVLVTTKGQPYLVHGSSPSSLNQQGLNAEQAGIPGRTKVATEGAVGYLSNDGIVGITSGQASLSMSQSLFTRKDWQARYGATLRNMVLGGHDGGIVGVIDPSAPLSVGANQGFIVRLDEERGQFSRLDLGESAYGLVSSVVTDSLYVGLSNGVAEFGKGSTDLPATWHSADYIDRSEPSFSVGVMVFSGAFTLTIFCDGIAIHTKSFSSTPLACQQFRVPPARGSRWSVRFVGTGTIKQFALANSVQDLKRT